MFAKPIIKIAAISLALSVAVGPSFVGAQSGGASPRSSVTGAGGQVPTPATAKMVDFRDTYNARDFDGARTLGGKACADGWAAACTMSARLLVDPAIGAPLATLARDRTLRGCKLGNAGGCFTLGVLIAQYPNTPTLDLTAVRNAHTRACELGHAESWALSGQMYAAGDGGAANFGEVRTKPTRALTIDSSNVLAKQTLALLNPSAAPNALPSNRGRGPSAPSTNSVILLTAADFKGIGISYATRGEASRDNAMLIGRVNLISALNCQIARGRNLHSGLVSSTPVASWPHFASLSESELESRVVLCERAHASKIPPVPPPPPRI